MLQKTGPNAEPEDVRVTRRRFQAAGHTDTNQSSLWKIQNTGSRCALPTTPGPAYSQHKDETSKNVASSVDDNSGTVYPYIDLICNKSGVYQVWFDFTGGHSGSGVGIVSMIQ
jgi:hypothetical protein